MPGACYPGMMDVCGFGFKRITSFLSRMLLQFMCFQALFVATTLQITPAISCFVVALLQFIPSIIFCTGQLLHSCCRGWSPRWAARRLATGKSVELNEGHRSHWNHRGGTTQPEWLDPKSPAIGIHRHPCRGGHTYCRVVTSATFQPLKPWPNDSSWPMGGAYFGSHCWYRLTWRGGARFDAFQLMCRYPLTKAVTKTLVICCIYRGWYSTTQLYRYFTKPL